MSWLIKERARIKGRIDHLQQLAAKIPPELETLSQQLRSLDAVFPLHQVKVEPAVIEGKRKYARKLLPHGAMTRGIYECLRESNGKGPLYSSEIAIFVARMNNFDIASIGKQKFVNHVSDRLRALANSGDVVRCHEIYPGNREEGRWCLPPEAD